MNSGFFFNEMKNFNDFYMHTHVLTIFAWNILIYLL